MLTFPADIVGCVIQVSDYPELAEAIPDTELEITECLAPDEIQSVTRRYQPYLEGITAKAAAVTLGDEMLFIGAGPENPGVVYYLDLEFGVFKLLPTVEAFLQSLSLSVTLPAEEADDAVF